MGVFYEAIPESLIKWILDQKAFWVSTAPLSGKGHVNLSPKGGPYFGVPDSKTFWYLDLTGSGNETISHLLEPGNGRITVLFNAFEGPPRILRIFGKGRFLENGTPEFREIVAREKIKCIPGTRSVIVVDIHQVGTSCGFSVPIYDFKEHRQTLNEFFERKDERFRGGNEKESMDRYWAFKNAWSMDGLPGVPRGLIAAKQFSIQPMKKMIGPLTPKNGGSLDQRSRLTSAYLVIALLSLMVAILAATHPVLQVFPVQGKLQDLMLRTRAIPNGTLGAGPFPG